jgi:hypothetical protein
MELKPNSPILGYVKEGDFAYFLYKETCENCTILISLVSHTASGSGIEIFINKGLSKLPTQNDY